jgi:hypothetical protein
MKTLLEARIKDLVAECNESGNSLTMILSAVIDQMDENMCNPIFDENIGLRDRYKSAIQLLISAETLILGKVKK